MPSQTTCLTLRRLQASLVAAVTASVLSCSNESPTAAASVASVQVTAPTTFLSSGSTAQLIAATLTASGTLLQGRPVTWTSSAPQVAAVSSTGLVTAGNITESTPAIVTISATAESITGSIVLSVMPLPISTITINAPALSIPSGSQIAVTATAKSANGATLTGRSITWTSSAVSTASVASTGIVTAALFPDGTARPVTISGSAEGVSGSVQLTVTPVPVATVSVSPSSATRVVSASQQFSALLTSSEGTVLSGRSLSWQSADTTIAIVSLNGLVTATRYPGTATRTTTITASSEGRTGSASFTVTPSQVFSVSITPAQPTMRPGDTLQMVATAQSANGDTLSGRSTTWQSANPLVASVSAQGFVSALSNGSTTISATIESQTGRATVTVPSALASSVASGFLYSMILKTDGTLWATGANDYGQFGNGTTGNYQLTPVQVMTQVSAVSTGSSHTAVVKSDGTLWTMGLNDLGELGVITAEYCAGNSCAKSPVQVATGVRSVSAGSGHTMILKTDGTLWATGRNDYGQLGALTVESCSGIPCSRSPVFVMSGVASVSAGAYHSLILKTDGTLWATGWNARGTLGDGTTVSKASPVLVMSDVAAASAGYAHSMFLKTNGTLWATGTSQDGELGISTSEICPPYSIPCSTTPVQIMSGVKSVSAGDRYTMILKTDGTLWATGLNETGNLGTGTTTKISTPVQVLAGVAAVQASHAHTMIVMTNGSLRSVGYNNRGALGDGTTTTRLTPVQVIP